MTPGSEQISAQRGMKGAERAGDNSDSPEVVFRWGKVWTPWPVCVSGGRTRRASFIGLWQAK